MIVKSNKWRTLAAAHAASSAPIAVVQPIPEGILSEDQMSSLSISEAGGQFIT